MDDLVFLDTNILIYAANEDSPYHANAYPQALPQGEHLKAYSGIGKALSG